MTTLTRNHADLALEVKAHIEADALVRGEYWDGSKGCFIGCLTHSSDPEPAVERFGLPEPLLRIAESIFEALPDEEGQAFFAALPDAVGCDGKDLSKVHWAFLAAELRLLPQHECINTVIAGMDLLVAGGEWSIDAAYDAYAASDAASAAAYTANAAYAAYAAACTARAADAAADTAYAAARASDYSARSSDYTARAADHSARASDYAAARIRQRDSLLEIIKQAPMGE